MRSATAWCSYASSACLVMAGAVYVKADDWGDDLYLDVVKGWIIAAGFFVAIIPFVRIVRQSVLHADK